MYFCDVAHHPGGRIVTAFAILPHGLLMHILVARNAIRFGIRKYQSRMARSTRDILVLPFQPKRSRIVVESLILKFPVLCCMANITIHLQRFTMR